MRVFFETLGFLVTLIAGGGGLLALSYAIGGNDWGPIIFVCVVIVGISAATAVMSRD